MNKLILAVLGAAVLVSSAAQAKECKTEKCHAEQRAKNRCVRCAKHMRHCSCPPACATVTESACTVVCPAGSKEIGREASHKVDGCDKVTCETMVPKTVRPVVTKVKRVVKTCGKDGSRGAKPANRRYNRQ